MSSSCSRPKDAVSAAKDVKTKEETSSDSEDKMAAINKNLSFSKRKPELLMDGGEVVEKRKKGRPRKDKMAAAVAQPFPQVETARKETCRNSTLQQRDKCLYPSPPQVAPPAERESSRAAAPPAAVAVLRLPTPSTQKAFSLQVTGLRHFNGE